MDNTLDDGFQHANTSAGGAGSTTGLPTTPAVGAANGWTDVHGNTASIVTDSGGSSHAASLTNGSGNDFRNGAIVRPGSEGAANQGILIFADKGASAVNAGVILRYALGTSGRSQGYWATAGSTAGSFWSLDGVGGFTEIVTTSTYSVFDPTHYYALSAGMVGSLFEVKIYDLGTSEPAQTGAVPTLPGEIVRAFGTDSSVAGSSTTPVGLNLGGTGANILRAVAYPTSTSLTLSESSAIINTTNTVNASGTFVNWTPGTPGSPAFTAVKTPTNDCTLSAQTITAYNAASFTLAHGATSGTITITDSTTGRTATITVASSTVLTLTSPSEFQVFQRSGTSGVISIAGTNNDSATHDIEASWNGGPYHTIQAGVVASGTFSGTLTAQPQGQGTCTVRFVDTPSTFIEALNVGIGDVFVIFGQSNAAGQCSACLTPFAEFPVSESLHAGLFRNNYAWREAFDPVDDLPFTDNSTNPGNGGGSGSVWPLVASEFMGNLDVPIGYVINATGGTAIAAFLPGTDHFDRTTLYGSMTYRARLCGGVKAVLWWQGESDGGGTQAAYDASFTTLAAAIVADLGVKIMPCILQAGTHFATVNAAIIHQIATNPNVLAGPDLRSLVGDGTTPNNGLHLVSPGSISDAASRWWQAMWKAFYEPAAPYTVAANVRSGTDRGDGTIGTLAVPIAGDVEAGVAVDATTGTFVVPTIGHVQSGIGYGAGGTEFTGTLTGGGASFPGIGCSFIKGV